MAVAASNQLLKILSDLDIDLMDVDNDKDYLRALMEATNQLTITNVSDNRIPILQKEIKRVRNKRKADSPSKGMKLTTKKINVNKFVDRKPSTVSVDAKPTAVPGAVGKQSVQKVQPQALLPSAKDPERNIMDKLGDGLNNILKSAKSLLQVDKNQLRIDKKTAKDSKKTQQKADKAEREKELEKKKKGETDQPNKVGSALKKPFTGFFDTIKTFFGNILAGSIVVKVVDWLKNPENAESIENFKNMIVDNFPLIVGGILAIAALPVVATIAGFTSMLLGGIGLLAPLIPFLLKAMLAAAAVIAVVKGGQWLWKKGKEGANWIHERFAGGKASAEGDKLNEAKLRESGVSQSWLDRRMGRYTVHTQKKDPSGKVRGYVESKSYDELSDEQKAAVDAFKAESKRMNDLEKERDRKIKELRKSLWEGPEGGTWKYTEGFARLPWNKRLTEEGKEKEKEINEMASGIYQNYEGRISSGDSIIPSANLGDKNVSSPNINQPLQGDSSNNLINLGGDTSAGGGGAGVGGGAETPSFSSSSGRLGNEITIGAGNN